MSRRLIAIGDSIAKGTYREGLAERLKGYFALGIPTLLIAGGIDEVVPFEKNSGKMIAYCKENECAFTAIVKPNCKHHPHFLEDICSILEFAKEKKSCKTEE